MVITECTNDDPSSCAVYFSAAKAARRASHAEAHQRGGEAHQREQSGSRHGAPPVDHA
jgi:hypothetical protein